MRAAAVDCGTNSLRLLVAEADGAGGLRELDRRLEIVRLGQGVDATGEFRADALARTFAVLDQYAQVISDLGVERTRFVATSASRDARNREELYAGVRSRLGVDAEVISGLEEAQLSFEGALAGVPSADHPVLVTDIGGGSTELISGDAAGGVAAAASLDVGSVRITERLFSADPPTPADLAAAARLVDGLLDDAGLDLGSARTWIGVAGTFTTLAAMILRLPTYDRSLVHGSRIPRPRLSQALDFLTARPAAEIRRVPSMHPQRADVITAGALVATRIAARVGTELLTVSESDILDGVALRLLADAS